MDYIILDGGCTATQFSNGDIVIYGDEQEARDEMRDGDILASMSYRQSSMGDTDNAPQYYCKISAVNTDTEYDGFEFTTSEDLQDKLKEMFLPKID